MACFIAVAAEAVVVSIANKSAKKKEAAAQACGTSAICECENKIPLSRKLSWLTNMLWGGTFLLAIEHIWHGEVVLWPPFLTAINTPSEIAPMLMEILTVGGSMVLLVTAIWFVGTLIADKLNKKSSDAVISANVE